MLHRLNAVDESDGDSHTELIAAIARDISEQLVGSGLLGAVLAFPFFSPIEDGISNIDEAVGEIRLALDVLVSRNETQAASMMDVVEISQWIWGVGELNAVIANVPTLSWVRMEYFDFVSTQTALANELLWAVSRHDLSVLDHWSPLRGNTSVVSCGLRRADSGLRGMIDVFGCASDADRAGFSALVDVAFINGLARMLDEETDKSLRLEAMNLLRSCVDLSLDVRLAIAERLIVAPSSVHSGWSPPRLMRIDPEDSRGRFIPLSVALDSLYPTELRSGSVDLRLMSSPASGVGVKFHLLNTALEEAFRIGSSLFEFTDEREVMLRPSMKIDSVKLDLLSSVGRMMGILIREGRRIPGHLSHSVWALIRDPLHVEPISIDQLEGWMEFANPGKLKMLKRILTEPAAWEGLEFPDSSPVGPANVTEYVEEELVADLITSVQEQARMLSAGIHEVLPYGMLGWFSAEELVDLFEPERTVNRTDLRLSTTVADSIADSNEIRWLWETLDEMTESELGLFLRFVSGSSFAPIQGFGRDGRKWLHVIIDDEGHRDSLPRAQLCFNQLRLPRYSSRRILRDQLLIGVSECDSLDHY